MKRKQDLLYVVVTFLLLLTSCQFNQKLRTGEEAYQYKQFVKASEMLMVEYEEARSNERKAHLAFLLGKTMEQLMRNSDAENWYSIAVKKDYGDIALLHLGRIYKKQGKYANAIGAFEILSKVEGRKSESLREILICKQALSVLNGSQKLKYDVKDFSINTFVSDYGAVYYDDNYIVYTSENEKSSGNNTYSWTGEKFSDLFIAPRDGSASRIFDATLNTRHNDGMPSFTKDMQTLYFNRCYTQNGSAYNENCKILQSKRVGDVWSEAAILPFTDDEYQYKHPTLIENDSILVFASDLHEKGGHLDLYYSVLDMFNNWSDPEPLSATINTLGNELFPVGDRDTLYFSSDFLPGLGGLDIFKTYLIDGSRWSQPEPMPYPINSGGDDFGFVIDHKSNGGKRKGLLSSSRNSGVKDDIFTWSELDIKPDTISLETNKSFNVFLALTTFEPIYTEINNPNSAPKGKAKLPGAYVKMTNDDGSSPHELSTNQNGLLVKELPDKKNVKLIVSKPGYLNKTVNVAIDQATPKNGESSVTVNVEVSLDKIFEGVEINIPNIYYEYDKWEIKSESQPILNDLIKILIENPQIKIELSSHTDCRGDIDYNQQLSQKRAQSVVDYLTRGGIHSDRLTSLGKGESFLTIQCPCEQCTEAEHQINRRTTFKIIKTKG